MEISMHFLRMLMKSFISFHSFKMMNQEETTHDIYTLKKLRQAWSSGRRFSFVYFWNVEDSDINTETLNEVCFSQFFPCQFTDDNGQKYCCCEQYMMAKKALAFNDQQSLRKIMNNKIPSLIKRFGRKVKNFESEKWNQISYEIVFQGNMYKFSQNEELKKYILSFRKNTIFVEASPFDDIWGIHLRATDQKALDPLQWEGTNKLGFQLTRVRDFLLQQ